MQLIEKQGVTAFYSGGMGDFDNMCESIVRELKHTNKNIKLFFVAPYMMQRLNTYKAYYELAYDDIIIPDIGNIHYKRAIGERNRWLVEHSEFVICLVEHKYGGAYKMYCYAKQKNTNIVNINHV